MNQEYITNVDLQGDTGGVAISSVKAQVTNLTATSYVVGPQGADGVGVPNGGLANQFLHKLSSDDWDTAWKTLVESDIDGLSASVVHKTGDEAIAGVKTFTGRTVNQLTDSTPGIPLVTADGVWQVRGGDGTKHIIFWPDMDGDGDYDADIYFKNNAYFVSSNAFHFRTYDFGQPEQGRVIIKSILNATSSLRTNYIQSGVNFSGSIEADLAITRYNSSFAWALFDESQNGYMGLGFSLDSGTGTYKQAEARLHVYDGATTVAVFQGANASGTGRIGLMDINTTSGSTVTVGAFGNEMIGRAGSTNVFRVSSIGFYAGGNVTPTASLHVAASTTSKASLRLPSGSAPTTPNSGDIWNQSGLIEVYDGSTAQIVAYQSYVSTQIAGLTTGVSSVFGRGGAVVAASGDYTASQITNTPAGNIAATTVQAALNELDTEKAIDALSAHLAGAETFNGVKTFAPTNSTNAFIVANATVATHMLRIDTSNARVGINLLTATALNATLAVNGNTVLGGGSTTPTARADIQASTTSFAALRIRSGVAPTSPNDGEIWYDGTDIKMRIAGATKTFTLV